MVFTISLILVLVFVAWGIFSPIGLANTMSILLNIMIEKFGWFYLIVTFSILLFSIYLAFSKYGKIVLGPDGCKPEYSDLTWFAMLFSAGMGIGLVFWGVAEPINHYIDPPLGLAGKTPEAAAAAMQFSFFHWGLHPWGIYTLIGLSLAYFQFRKGCKGLISSTFYPLLGEKVNGSIGKLIDILAVIATVFGVATSLGLGTMQINGGLNYLFGVPIQTLVEIIIIVIVTILFLVSATTGLDKGIKILSNINIFVAFGVLLFVLFLGPTSFIIDTFTVTMGGYLQNIVDYSLRLTPFSGGTWVGKWTIFYWSWWIAWAPFVGMFIARVSKGRTIKEFVLGVLFIPSIFSFIWFAVFGGTALNLELFHHIDIAAAVQKDITSALFITLENLPLGTIISLLATVLIITFFVTSADSATFVLGMFSTDGNLNPPNRIKIVWGVLQALIAIVLLLSGGLAGLQTASIITALPFSLILALMCVSTLKALKQDPMIKDK